MVRLIIPVGLPRAGKTTYMEQLMEPVVSRDSIRLALHGQPYIQEMEDWVTRIQMVMIEALRLSGHKIIILDECFMKQQYIDTWIQDEKYDIQLEYFTTHIDTCKERAVLTDQEYLIPVIDNMFNDCDVDVWMKLYEKEHHREK